MKNLSKKLMTVVLAGAMLMAMTACGDKSEETKKKDKTTTTSTAQQVQVEAPKGVYSEIYQNLVYVAMSTGKWTEDPNYVITKDDLKAYFNEVSAENNFYQLMLCKGMAGDSGEVYHGSNGATYHYLADAETFGTFLYTMYGVDQDFYKQLTTEDLSVSSLFYDSSTNAVYYFNGMFADMSCFYSKTEECDDYTTNIYYSVSNKVDDGTPYNGQVVINLGVLESEFPADRVINSISFIEEK